MAQCVTAAPSLAALTTSASATLDKLNTLMRKATLLVLVSIECLSTVLCAEAMHHH
jgi:hypothetical protein